MNMHKFLHPELYQNVELYVPKPDIDKPIFDLDEAILKENIKSLNRLSSSIKDLKNLSVEHYNLASELHKRLVTKSQ